MKRLISVANDFSKYPLGRYERHGPNNGAKFRELFLLPALKEYDEVTVDLDGVDGEYGSSFLSEAFAGVVHAGYDIERYKKQLVIRTEDKALKGLVEKYIKDAIEGKEGP